MWTKNLFHVCSPGHGSATAFTPWQDIASVLPKPTCFIHT